MPLSLIVNLDVPDEVILSRISGELSAIMFYSLLEECCDRSLGAFAVG